MLVIQYREIEVENEWIRPMNFSMRKFTITDFCELRKTLLCTVNSGSKEKRHPAHSCQGREDVSKASQNTKEIIKAE